MVPAYCDGAPTASPGTFDNTYFTNLVSKRWAKQTASSGVVEYKAQDADLYMLESDLVLRFDPELMAIAQEFAVDGGTFRAQFAAAWTKAMNADLYDGPTHYFCRE